MFANVKTAFGECALMFRMLASLSACKVDRTPPDYD